MKMNPDRRSTEINRPRSATLSFCLAVFSGGYIYWRVDAFEYVYCFSGRRPFSRPSEILEQTRSVWPDRPLCVCVFLVSAIQVEAQKEISVRRIFFGVPTFLHGRGPSITLRR